MTHLTHSALRAMCITAAIPAAWAAAPPASISYKIQVPTNMRNGVFATGRFLNVPAGFGISVLAQVNGARQLLVLPNGDVLVSQPGAGSVTLLRSGQSFNYVSGLNNPHGLAYDIINGVAYVLVAEANQISRFAYSTGDTQAHGRTVLIKGLPEGGHNLKSVVVDSQHRIYVAIGSSCNVCTSDTTSEPVRASIYVYNSDGSGGRIFARGLRNAEGLAFVPGTNQLWAAVNGRDQIPDPVKGANYGKVFAAYVDNHPPEPFTAVRDGGNYGWPFCNPNPDSASALNDMPFDLDLDTNGDGHVDCSKMDTINKGIQAHSAPLSLAFLGGTAFPQAYRDGAVIGLHGSWNRSLKTGYKVVYFPWNSATQTPGAQMDLVSGWLDDQSQQNWGRPVGVAVDQTGSLLIADDTAGAVYRLTFAVAGVSAASGAGLVAPASIATVHGTNLANTTVSAPTADWPLSLGGVSLFVTDGANVDRQVQLAYVSPSQINFVIPADSAQGTGTLRISPGASLGSVQIASTAPGLFSGDGTGHGAAAAIGVRVVIPAQVQSLVTVFKCDSANNCSTVPIDMGVDAPVTLVLFGTGIRNAAPGTVKVNIGNLTLDPLYAGPQSTYPGLDQINVGLPISLRGSGEVQVSVTIGNQTSNTVTISIL